MRKDPGYKWRLTHHVFGGFIVLGWLAAILVQNCGGHDAISVDPENMPPPQASTETTTRHYGIYYQGRKIGFAESSRRSLDDGVLFHDRSYWRFRAQGAVKRLALQSTAEIGLKWNLRSFSVQLDAEVAKMSARGKVLEDRIQVELTTGDHTQEIEIPIESPVLLPGLVRAFVAAHRPPPGTALEIDVFNPLVRTMEKLEVVVGERTDDGWRITEILHGSLKTTAWIDEEGLTVREQTAMGFELAREPKEQALALSNAEGVPDLVFDVAVPVRGKIPSDPNLEALRLRLEGIDPTSFPALHGDGQKLDGNLLTVLRQRLPPNSPYEIPTKGGPAPLHDVEELRAALASEPLIQSDHPEIVEAAVRICGHIQDPRAATRAIAAWVFQNLVRASNVGVPSAIEVLKEKRGDCNEHTVLFTALARARGIPTRMAAGVVRARGAERGGESALFYHAWPEVWLGEWIRVDPTLDQIPADLTHIRFIVGGLDRQVEILKLIGALRVEVVQ